MMNESMRMDKIVTVLITGIFLLISLTAGWSEAVELVVENSPYLVTGRLVIKNGDVLSVEPGVVLEMGRDAEIVIEGRVDISGYPKGGEVIFKVQGPSGSAHKGFWKGIVVKSRENNLINYAIVQHAKTGITIVSGSSVKILNNTITQNKIGVKAEGAQDLSIARNSFLGNFTDIEMKESYGNVKKNYFQGSLTCLKLLESYPQVEGNYFEQAHKYVMEFNNDSDLAITENWWGRGDRKRIKDLISLEGKGKVHFDSFLKEPQQLNEVGVDLAEGL